MTLAQLMQLLLRRWPIVLLGVALTLGAAVLGTRAEPVFHARTEMVFLAPPSARYPNELVTQTEALIVTAGAVVKRVEGAREELKYGSPVANLVGAADVGETTWIGLLDTGTQWVSSFENQIVLIDAIGDSPSQVQERISSAADALQRELQSLQQEQSVPAEDYITARMSPESPVVEEVRGSRVRAIGMTLAIGGFLTVAAVVVLEVSGQNRSARRHDSPAGAAPQR